MTQKKILPHLNLDPNRNQNPNPNRPSTSRQRNIFSVCQERCYLSSDEDDKEAQAPKKPLQKWKAKWVGAGKDDDEAERSLRARMLMMVCFIYPIPSPFA
jgi:hypothetical protein